MIKKILCIITAAVLTVNLSVFAEQNQEDTVQKDGLIPITDGNIVFSGRWSDTEKGSKKCGFEISESEVFGRGDTVVLKSAERKFDQAASYDACIYASALLHIEPKSKSKVVYTLAAALTERDAQSAAVRLQNDNAGDSASRLDLTAAELGMTRRDITSAFSLLTELRFSNARKKDTNACDRLYSQSDLWQFGISGDYPFQPCRWNCQ